MKLQTVLLSALLLTSLNSRALKVMDPAPPLGMGEWFQGEPVKAFEKGKVYVVEFWATWCGPCKAAIPHLNELHKSHAGKGVVVIGQNVWEKDESQVPGFVKEMGDRMSYRLTLDNTNDGTGVMAETWMKAAGRKGIPSTFVVDGNGRIAWIGHPMGLTGPMLDQILAGTFDAVAVAEKQRIETEAMDAATTKLAKAWKALGENKPDEALAVLDDLEKSVPERARIALWMLRVDALGKKGDAAAFHAAIRAADKDLSDHRASGQLAWMLATVSIDKPDLALAHDLVTKAMIADPDSLFYLDAAARIAFLRGEKEEALKLIRLAVAKSAGTPDGGIVFKILARHYEKDELPDIQHLRDEIRAEMSNRDKHTGN